MTQTTSRATLTIAAAGIVFTSLLASPGTAGAIEDQKTRTRALLASRSSVSTEMSARAASLRVDEYTLTTELPSVHFDFASATIRATDRKVLDANAAWLRADPTLLIALEGAADPRGSGDYNLVLGERRARAVRDLLVARGVAPERIAILSTGEARPACMARDNCWALDRRVDFLVKRVPRQAP